VVPPASHKVSRVSWYSGSRLWVSSFHLPGYHRLRRAFPDLFDYNSSITLCRSSTPHELPHTVWALSLSLAATQKIDFSFSSSGYLDVSVPPVYLHTAMYSPYGTCGFPQVSFLIRISPDQSLFAAPRSFSQLIASFIGS
jgi:hypothetical protein